jgi:hypothetical protein
MFDMAVFCTSKGDPGSDLNVSTQDMKDALRQLDEANIIQLTESKNWHIRVR